MRRIISAIMASTGLQHSSKTQNTKQKSDLLLGCKICQDKPHTHMCHLFSSCVVFEWFAVFVICHCFFKFFYYIFHFGTLGTCYCFVEDWRCVSHFRATEPPTLAWETISHLNIHIRVHSFWLSLQLFGLVFEWGWTLKWSLGQLYWFRSLVLTHSKVANAFIKWFGHVYAYQIQRNRFRHVLKRWFFISFYS